MKINNQIDTTSGGNTLYLDSREIKANGIKVRLYGDAEMGYSYFQLTGKTKDNGKPEVAVIRSVKFPTMENQSEGFQGAEQTPSECFYIVAWNYDAEAPCILTLDKQTLINPILTINNDSDLADVTDYDFKITFDDSKKPADKYQVTRLDKTDLTADQKKALKEFNCDLKAHAEGGEAFVKAEGEVTPF